jgi:hypothetical protein
MAIPALVAVDRSERVADAQRATDCFPGRGRHSNVQALAAILGGAGTYRVLVV